MRLKKKVQGKWIDLDYIELKRYPRYTRYQVYKLEGNDWIPIYTECLSPYQLAEIVKNRYIIADEPVETLEEELLDLCM